MRASIARAARFAAIIAALLLAAAPGAVAQSGSGAGSLFPGLEAAPPTGESPRERAEEDRPPDLAAYGEIAESYATRSALETTQRRIQRFRERLVATLERAPDLGAEVEATLARASPTGSPLYFVGLAAFMAFLIGVGRGAGLLFAVYVARPIFVRMQRPEPRDIADKLPVLTARVGLVVVGLAVNLVVSLAVGAGFFPEENDAAVAFGILVFGAFALTRIVDTVWRMVLAPYLPAYRIPRISDAEAVRLYRWIAWAATAGIALTAALLLMDEYGLPPESSALLHILATVIQVGILAAGALRNRRAVTRALLRGGPASEGTWLMRLAAALWLPAFLLYLAYALAGTAFRAIVRDDLGAPPLGALMLVIIGGLMVYAATLFAVQRATRRRRSVRVDETAGSAPAVGPRVGDDEDADGDGEGGGAPVAAARTPAHPDRPGAMRTYEDLAARVASLFAIGLGVWALAWFWFGDSIFEDDSPFDRAQDVVDLLFVGYVVYHAVRIWIDRRIEEEGGEELDLEPGDEGGGASASSRLATLLPLVRNFVLAVVATSTLIFIAMEFGANVAPLFAGAGIVGLAIGFGAQTLVRDILSGAFFLFDDAFRKGEYIDIGDVKGTVEKISLRSFQLRHHLGALNTIPFGEIRFLTNYSRDWVMMKLPLRLTYDTDPEKVRKLIKKLGQELLDNPTEGHKFMQPLKSQGVYMMEDSAMIIRVKYMTKPGDQWTTRKLVYASIRELFEREGIRFAHREVTVRIPELDGKSAQGLEDSQMRAVGGAARRALDDAEAEEALARRPAAVGDER